MSCLPANIAERDCAAFGSTETSRWSCGAMVLSLPGILMGQLTIPSPSLVEKKK